MAKSETLHEKLAKQRRTKLCSEIGWHGWNRVGRSANAVSSQILGCIALGWPEWRLSGEIALPNANFAKFNFNFF